MSKKHTIGVATIVAVAACGLSTAIAGVGPKVTGGAGSITADGVEFSLAANAIETGKFDPETGEQGEVKGSIQYSRNEQGGTSALHVHATTTMYDIGDEGVKAVVCGPAEAQFDPSGEVGPDDYLVVNLLEGGTGSGDMVRVRLLSGEEVKTNCSDAGSNTSFPGVVNEGEFKIRSESMAPPPMASEGGERGPEGDHPGHGLGRGRP